MASSTSRIEVFRGRPPGYTGMRGWTRAHCSSVRSLGYRGVRIPHRTRQTTPYRTDSYSHLADRLGPHLEAMHDLIAVAELRQEGQESNDSNEKQATSPLGDPRRRKR